MDTFNEANAKRAKLLAVGSATLAVFVGLTAGNASAEAGEPADNKSAMWSATTHAALQTAERIADAGTPEEVYKHAVHLRDGGDTSHAMGFLRYAAFNGHVPAAQLLVMIYQDGALGVRANFRLAKRYRAMAAGQNVF